MDKEEEMKPRSHKAKGFAEGEMAELDEAGCRQEPNPLSHSSVTVLECRQTDSISCTNREVKQQCVQTNISQPRKANETRRVGLDGTCSNPSTWWLTAV